MLIMIPVKPVYANCAYDINSNGTWFPEPIDTTYWTKYEPFSGPVLNYRAASQILIDYIAAHPNSNWHRGHGSRSAIGSSGEATIKHVNIARLQYSAEFDRSIKLTRYIIYELNFRRR